MCVCVCVCVCVCFSLLAACSPAITLRRIIGKMDRLLWATLRYVKQSHTHLSFGIHTSQWDNGMDINCWPISNIIRGFRPTCNTSAFTINMSKWSSSFTHSSFKWCLVKSPSCSFLYTESGWGPKALKVHIDNKAKNIYWVLITKWSITLQLCIF